MTDLDDLLLRATCAVRGTDDKIIGTGWLLDAEGHVMTAGHVLGRGPLRDNVTVTFQDDSTRYNATRVQHAYDAARGIDCAVLKITDSPPDRSALPICLNLSPSGDFKLFGYGTTLGNVSAAIGKIFGSHLPGDQSANRLLTLSTEQSNEGGYSGAAIFSIESRAVVGIQIEGADVPPGTAHATTVLAMPMYRIAQLCKNLPVFATAIQQQGEQDYAYHVYLSYRRGGKEETWLDMHFRKELEDWLAMDLKADKPIIFYNHNEKRSAWKQDVVEAIRHSRCLVAISTAQYWDSPECVAEFETFRQRQRIEKVPLALGVVFHGMAPPSTEIDWEDFKDYAVTYQAYPKWSEYGAFERAIKQLSRKLAALIENAPQFKSHWPVIAPVEPTGGGTPFTRPRL